MCDEVSKIKDLRYTYFLFFHAGHQGKTDLNFFGCVTNLLGPSRSFSTPNFLLGASRKGLNFMIAFDHKLIFSDHDHGKVAVKYLLRFSMTPPRFARRG